MVENALTVPGPSPAADGRGEVGIGLSGVRVRGQSDGADVGWEYSKSHNVKLIKGYWLSNISQLHSASKQQNAIKITRFFCIDH
jgi:hypothetical protein